MNMLTQTLIKMKSLLLFLLIPFSNSPISYRQLSWSDFKGKPTNDHAASTCTGIVIEKDTAYAIFEPDESWTRTSNPIVLKHEQVHFAITKLYAEKIAWLTKSRCECYSEIAEELKKWEAMEQSYDLITDHGLNVEKQKEWEQNIKL